jgi:hypothetical protein
MSQLVCSDIGWPKEVTTYGDLEHELLAIVGSLKSVENGRELLGVELDIDDGTCLCSAVSLAT